MKRYERLDEIGSGSYGVVYRALDKKTNEVVAVKKMIDRKYTSLEDCANLTEVKALWHMNHPNIIKLKEIVNENDKLFLIFELMECTLFQCINNRRTAPFSESEIRNLCFQVFQGLAHMHGKGYFHRDLKPDNLLVSKDVIKIAHLGMARETKRKPPYTRYVMALGYRAPEVFLCSRVHGPAVDMWAMGAIMAELFTNQPLFEGESDGEVLYKICSVIGSPTKSTWSKGIRLACDLNYKFPDLPGMSLATVLPSASKEALCLIANLLSWNPSKRPTAGEALEHPFFQLNPDPPRKWDFTTSTKSRTTFVSEKVEQDMHQRKFVLTPFKSRRKKQASSKQIRST